MGQRLKSRPAAVCGVLACGLVLVALVSTWIERWPWDLHLPGAVRVSMWRSAVTVARSTPSSGPFYSAPYVELGSLSAAEAEQLVQYLAQYRLRPQWWPTGWCHWPDWGVTIPLWLLFSAFAAPTAYLWWRDRRRIPAGHCQRCGYNLTANVSGRCPECGELIGSGKG
jgi:hypothetical protein